MEYDECGADAPSCGTCLARAAKYACKYCVSKAVSGGVLCATDCGERQELKACPVAEDASELTDVLVLLLLVALVLGSVALVQCLIGLRGGRACFCWTPWSGTVVVGTAEAKEEAEAEKLERDMRIANLVGAPGEGYGQPGKRSSVTDGAAHAHAHHHHRHHNHSPMRP